MVSVYSTTLPHLSETVRLVVWMFSVSLVRVSAVRLDPHLPSYDVTSPAATGLGSVPVGLIRQARSAAYLSESSALRGTRTWAGSPTYFPRSANASALASR